jgi:hypothetical protein
MERNQCGHDAEAIKYLPQTQPKYSKHNLTPSNMTIEGLKRTFMVIGTTLLPTASYYEGFFTFPAPHVQMNPVLSVVNHGDPLVLLNADKT